MKDFSEKELVGKLDKILKKEFGTNLAFHEFSAGYGIADLVFAPNYSFKKSSISRTPITDFSGLSLLLSLEDDKKYDQNDIYDLFPQLSQKEVYRLLHSLVSNKYLELSGKEIYRKLPSISPLNPIKKVIAIEVKLKDHKHGLIQARRYQYFADESYLAILKEAKHNINFEEFNKHNIGIILFDSKTNDIEVIHPQPTNCQFQNNVSIFAKEMMLSQSLNFFS